MEAWTGAVYVLSHEVTLIYRAQILSVRNVFQKNMRHCKVILISKSTPPESVKNKG